jgi:hypothetical protein
MACASWVAQAMVSLAASRESPIHFTGHRRRLMVAFEISCRQQGFYVDEGHPVTMREQAFIGQRRLLTKRVVGSAFVRLRAWPGWRR